MLFCRLAGVFCSQFRSLSLFIVNFWCFIWYSAHFSSLTCRENIFIKVSVVWLVLSGCQVCPILYILFWGGGGRGRVCRSTGFSGTQWRCAVQTLRLKRKSICILKSQFQLKKKTLNPPKIYKVVNCELWLTFRSLESFPMQSPFCLLRITISLLNPL